MGNWGHNHAVKLGGYVVHTQHAGDRETVNIGVNHANVEPLGGHGGSQVSGYRRFTNAALTGGDRIDAGQVAGLSERNFRLGHATAQLCA